MHWDLPFGAAGGHTGLRLSQRSRGPLNRGGEAVEGPRTRKGKCPAQALSLGSVVIWVDRRGPAPTQPSLPLPALFLSRLAKNTWRRKLTQQEAALGVSNRQS